MSTFEKHVTFEERALCHQPVISWASLSAFDIRLVHFSKITKISAGQSKYCLNCDRQPSCFWLVVQWISRSPSLCLMLILVAEISRTNDKVWGTVFYLILNLIYFVVCILFQVDLSGFLNFWGITIDTVVAVQLILAIGLAVDYSVHIGHTFMIFSGSRNGKSNCYRFLNEKPTPTCNYLYVLYTVWSC